MLDRRAFVKGLGLLAGAFAPSLAPAEDIHRIGLVVPGGALAESGRLMVLGAQLGLADANALATMFGKRLDLLQEVADGPEAVLAAGLRLARQERVVALVGGADDASAEALREGAQQAGVLFFNVGAMSDRLRNERCHRNAFHLEGSLAMYVSAAGQWLEQRKLARWVIVASGSSFGRGVEQAAAAFLGRKARTAAAAETAAPRTTDWNPMLQRLRGIAPEAVVLGLETPDLLAFLRQFRASGLPFQVAGVAPDPSALLSADPEELTGIWPLLWHHELERFSARELNARFRRRFGRPFEARSWTAWAAVKLLGEAIVRTGSADFPGLLKFLEGAPPFDGHKGAALTFREWDHQLRQPLYVTAPRKKEQGRWGALQVVGDVPGRVDLDTIGEPKAESRCRFET